MYALRDPKIFFGLGSLYDLSEECSYPNPRYLVFKLYSERKTYQVLFEFINNPDVTNDFENSVANDALSIISNILM